MFRSEVKTAGRSLTQECIVFNKKYFQTEFVYKGSFYIAQYLVRWTAQSASHFLR